MASTPAPPDLSNLVIPGTDDPFGLGTNGAMPMVGEFLGLPSGATLNDVIKAFNQAGNTPQGRTLQAQVTQLMYRAGFYPSTALAPVPGAPLQPDDINAFKNVALTSARTGADIPTYLTQSADQAQQIGLGTKQGKTGGANVYSTSASDPNQLGQLADRLASTILGHGLDPAKRAQVISVITAHQRAQDQLKNQTAEAASRRQFDTAVANEGTGTDTYLPPTTIDTPAIDPASDIEAQIRADNPKDAAVNRGLEVGNMLMNALVTSPVGHLPNG